MPTAYIKKLAKLNKKHISTIEKFWSQAKKIAESENSGKNWGLITTIFKNKLKANGLKITGMYFITPDGDLRFDKSKDVFNKGDFNAYIPNRTNKFKINGILTKKELTLLLSK